jgi:poly-gamma-glutamate capsule biosynthesis protein CapA/YwtB (metallophosphatase superfamily)
MPSNPHRPPLCFRRGIFRAAFTFLLIFAASCQASPAAIAPPAAQTIPASPLSPTLPEKLSPEPPRTSAPSPSPSPSLSPSPLPPTLTPSITPTAQPITTTLLFTGIIVPARCVQAKLDSIGNPNYPYEEVKGIISKADLAVGTFNATMSDRVEHTGCLTTWQLVGSPDNADAAAWAGFDLMSVATNHMKDCGIMKSWCDYAFFDTLENLNRVGIETVGGGKDLTEALQPVVYTLNGVRFGFVALGDSKMDRGIFAGDDHPGIAELNIENIQRAVRQVRQEADVVIALPHWGSEDIALPNWLQKQEALALVGAGADLVVGNHTHVIQSIQEIDGVPVFYSLGNFVFDQGLRDHRQAIIVLVKFRGAHLVGYELIPTHTDADGRIHVADTEETAEILQRIEEISQVLR